MNTVPGTNGKIFENLSAISAIIHNQKREIFHNFLIKIKTIIIGQKIGKNWSGHGRDIFILYFTFISQRFNFKVFQILLILTDVFEMQEIQKNSWFQRNSRIHFFHYFFIIVLYCIFICISIRTGWLTDFKIITIFFINNILYNILWDFLCVIICVIKVFFVLVVFIISKIESLFRLFVILWTFSKFVYFSFFSKKKCWNWDDD